MRILHVCETARGGVGTYIDTLVGLCRKEDVQQVVLPLEHRSMLSEAADCRTFSYPSRSISSGISNVVDHPSSTLPIQARRHLLPFEPRALRAGFA